ncbi:GntR family transcriptional regulator [Nonomuraea sp. NPDC003707]|uniref:GntR family transcriptional regulator n=1 Tax=Nonomuraea sp. NPDC049625 TaxID=3155775 RepID=UPI00341B3296
MAAAKPPRAPKEPKTVRFLTGGASEGGIVVDKLPDQLYWVLQKRIVHGEMRPGQRIDIQALIDEFGISKTPVRDALNRLEYDGLVRSKQRSGTYVVTPTIDDVTEFCQLRKAVEWICTGLATETMPESVLRDLRDEIVEAENATKKGDLQPFLDSDFRLHRTIIAWAGNERLMRVRLSVEPFLKWIQVLGATGIDRAALSTKRHLEIVDAMLDRDAEAASAFAALHVDEVETATKEDLPKVLGER